MSTPDIIVLCVRGGRCVDGPNRQVSAVHLDPGRPVANKAGQVGYALGAGVVGPDRLDAPAARVEEALEAAEANVPKHETLLMVVGRGASDPDANSNISKVMRLLWEAFGFGWGEVCYSGVTFPLVEPGLEQATKLGFKRIIVFPYFLFTGVLVKRIYDYTDAVAARHPKIEFIKAPYLNAQPLVLETFVDRMLEIQEGTGNMNCQMCKYREQVLGFEAEVGLPQESHHHHVEGIGTDEDYTHVHGHGHHHSHSRDHAHSHGHGHNDDHDHDHGHHPYPHADHPLGPVSMEKPDVKID